MSDHQDTLDLLKSRKGKDPGLTLAMIEGFLLEKLGVIRPMPAAPEPEPEPEAAPRRRRRGSK